MTRNVKQYSTKKDDESIKTDEYETVVAKDERMSVYTETSDESRVLKNLEKYYYNEDENNISRENNTARENNISISQRKEQLSCSICRIQRQGKNDNYIVLSCNHIFHVCCLTENHFVDIMDYNIIDQEYFRTRKCPTCFKALETEELMFLHSKFLTGTKERMTNHDLAIESLENRLKVLKEELRTCYDYKHKLEREREKSKQIVTTLMTMM
jgi:hypothetical protein